MPIYDFRCNECERTDSVFCSLSQYEHARICPYCGNTRQQELGASSFDFSKAGEGVYNKGWSGVKPHKDKK